MVYKDIPSTPTVLVKKILMNKPRTFTIKPPTSNIKIDILKESFFNIHLSYSSIMIYNNTMSREHNLDWRRK